MISLLVVPLVKKISPLAEDPQTAASMRLGAQSNTDASAISLDTHTIPMESIAARATISTTTIRIDAVESRTTISNMEGVIKQLLLAMTKSY